MPAAPLACKPPRKPDQQGDRSRPEERRGRCGGQDQEAQSVPRTWGTDAPSSARPPVRFGTLTNGCCRRKSYIARDSRLSCLVSTHRCSMLAEPVIARGDGRDAPRIRAAYARRSLAPCSARSVSLFGIAVVSSASEPSNAAASELRSVSRSNRRYWTGQALPQPAIAAAKLAAIEAHDRRSAPGAHNRCC